MRIPHAVKAYQPLLNTARRDEANIITWFAVINSHLRICPEPRGWHSKEFIALGLKIPRAMEWNPGCNENTYYAFDMTMVEFGTLNHNRMGVLTLVANHGLAFDRAYTSKHSLFFMFNLV